MSAKAGKAASRDEAEWQRLDMWLWCARAAKGRSDCARLVEDGAVRLNRQPTVKAHAKLRIGDVLTMALRGEVRVWRVMALATRRGSAPEARLLYEEVPEGGGAAERSNPCAKPGRAAYRGAEAAPEDGDAPDEPPGEFQDSTRDHAGEPAGDYPGDHHQER
jgi:ribosome-associated heat shock protein Hsp15